jgi:hypothetical protein
MIMRPSFAGVPRYVWAVMTVALLGLFLALAVSWQLHSLRVAESKRDCERAVASRQDGRSMWLYLASRSDDTRKVTAFLNQLDSLLPPLRCVGGDAVPIRHLPIRPVPDSVKNKVK